MIQAPQTSTLFPYTTLFRSVTYRKFPVPHAGSSTLTAQSLRWNVCSAAMAFLRAVVPPFVAVRSCCTCARTMRSEEHTSELQSQSNLVCRLLLEKKKQGIKN